MHDSGDPVKKKKKKMHWPCGFVLALARCCVVRDAEQGLGHDRWRVVVAAAAAAVLCAAWKEEEEEAEAGGGEDERAADV